MFNQIKPKQNSEGCKIKVKRDRVGRISGIETNGKCTKDEVQVFRENLKDIKEE